MRPPFHVTSGLMALAACAVILAGCAGGPKPSHGHHSGHDRGRGDGGYHEITPDVFLFLPFDADHDNKFTKAELAVATETLWRQVARGRPALSLIELRDAFAKIYGQSDFDFGVLGFDPDGDHKVTADEFAHALTQHFNALDLNGDGVLDRKEFYRQPERNPGRPMRDDNGPY